jgi:hypothetical protein
MTALDAGRQEEHTASLWAHRKKGDYASEVAIIVCTSDGVLAAPPRDKRRQHRRTGRFLCRRNTGLNVRRAPEWWSSSIGLLNES